MCWNLCKSPGAVEVNGDASAARGGVAQAYARWRTECKDFTPLPQQRVIDACRSCMSACLTIGGYAWDQGTGANDKLKWCTRYTKDLQQ